MVDQIERLPVSPDRDRMLSEVRSRMVDLDTGVTPRAMLPVREPVLASPRPPKRDGASRITPTAPAAEPVRPAPSAGARSVMSLSLWLRERLSVEVEAVAHACFDL